MHQQPQRCEIGEGFALEHAPQVGLDIGRAGKAGVAANQAKENPVRAQAPESAFTGIEPVPDGRCSRTPAPISRQMSAQIIEIDGRRHDHDRCAAVEPLKRHRELPLSDGACADPTNISETEHVAQELLDESDRGSVRRGLACGQIGKKRLADAEITRDLVTQGEALRHAVIRLSLCAGLMLRDAGEHRGRNQGAFHRHGIEGERARAAGPIAGHIGSNPGRNQNVETDDVGRQHRLDADAGAAGGGSA
jgi:hypothetical protein